MAQYRVHYEADRRHVKAIEEPRLFATPHQSQQMPLWTLGEGEWLKVMRLPTYAPQRQHTLLPVQQALFPLPEGGAVSPG